MLFLAACVVLSGCDKKSGQDAKCGEIRREFSRILKGATYACGRDEECALYPILVNCGGVIEEATAQRLDRLYRHYREIGCPRIIACAAHLAETPACVRGRCTGARIRHGR